MFRQHFRLIAALAGAVAAATAVPARAGDCCNTCTRTTYKTEYRQEAYTAYRYECTPEVRTRTCTTYKRVAETRTVNECVCVSVPCVEERTVMQSFVTCKPVTTTVRKCVDRGHWECREVPCCSNSCGSCGHHRSHRRHGGCCEETCCNSCNSCDSCCTPTRTERVWVSCKEWTECPVTCMVRTCECRPVTCKVTTCKHEVRQVQRQVTCWKCVPECHTENYTVLVPHCVPYQATRCVAVCVPCVEQVPACETTCCKPACNSCCNTCNTCCDSCCHTRHHRERCCHERTHRCRERCSSCCHRSCCD